jgi:redox-sensing transcriptional repressor
MANIKGIRSVPEPTLRRLSSYNVFLKNRLDEEGLVISCSQIGAALRIEPTTVRKDLAYTGITGKPRVGYDIKLLVDAVERFMGWKNVSEAILVGVGCLGTALLGYPKFEHYGMNIVAVFDSSPEKVGKNVHGHEVLSVDRLPELTQRLHTLIGIITTPAEVAQSVANLMILSGIRAIWNLAPISLTAPEGVIVKSEDLFSSLAILSSKLEAQLRTEAES